MTPSESAPLPVWSNFEFTGDSLEYFKIWIVNILLTIVTLGFYSAWAKVRTESYFYGNTVLNNSSFSYLADPVKILKGRVIAVGFFAIFWCLFEFYPQASLWTLFTVCLLFPFVLVTAISFRMRNSAYRNIRFHFRHDYMSAYRLFIVPIGITMILTWLIYNAYLTSDFVSELENADNSEFKKEDMLFSIFFLAILPVVPYVDFVRRRFIIDHTQYGSANATFHANAWGFYKPYLLMLLIGTVIIIIFSMAAGGIAVLFGIQGDNGGKPLEQSGAYMMLIFMTIIIIYGISFFLFGYLRARITNLTYNSTEIGPLLLQSHLKGRKIGWIYLTNTIAIIFSLGLLIPWSMIRMARYVAGCTEFLAKDMEGINAIQQPDRSALGEELGEIFDLDLGL